MKNSNFSKFLIMLVCVISLAALVVSGTAAICAAATGLYDGGTARLISPYTENRMEGEAHWIATEAIERYAADALGGCSQDFLDAFYNPTASQNGYVEIFRAGEAVYRDSVHPDSTQPFSFFGIRTSFPSANNPCYGEDGEELDYLGEQDFSYEDYHGQSELTLSTYMSPMYDVIVHLAPSDYVTDQETQVFAYLYQYRYTAIGVAAVSLVIFLAFFVALCCTAAKRPGSQDLRPGGLNRMPLDVYAAIILIGESCLLMVMVELLMPMLLNWSVSPYLTIPLICAVVVGGALLLVSFLFAFAAQVKVSGSFWWHHSLIGWCCDKLKVALKFLWKGTLAVFRMMPMIWQWLLTLVALVFAGILCFVFAMMAWHDFFQLFWLAMTGMCVLCFVGVICYAGYAFGVLMKGVRAMAQGQLYYQIPTSNLIGSFRDFAVQLNAMAGAMQRAVGQQMKSERMKTELITNVSHDIKTPLTSIINYVDLLKKDHTPEAEEQYLEVLDRQSQRLKKLIDDLMEMSKASSGNISVELAKINAAEAVNQALGEFGDKLDAVGLIPVFRHPEEPVMITADGRLLWRVLSNVLSNAVKYALPNTRLYLDLMELQGNAVITVKNISKDQLNVDAEELMERFVRGDASRNTEGSGLGLNIAKSLVEFQKGQMHLMVDGDLFKVTLMFPLA